MNKTVIITGASRGIGASTAKRFAKEGWNVVINYLNSKADANNIVNELLSQKSNAFAFKADVTSREEVDSMVLETIRQFGTVDSLINNAGIAQQKLFTDISQKEWDHMFDINVKGIYNCCQAVLPSMIHNKSGSIVNISSMWGVTGSSCEVHYSASKAAVIGLTKSLAKELAPSRIRVNCVSPGVIETQMNSNLSRDVLEELKQDTPLGIIGNPEDIANCIWFLSSNESLFITGENINANGGMVI